MHRAGTAPLTLQYGVRVDAERYGSSASANADVAHLYGLQTDRLLHSLALEPMAGFTWNFSNYRVPIAEGAYAINHRNSLSGGVREYRGVLALSTLASVAQQTGLANGLTTLRCIGDAVPFPDWRGYSTGNDAIPDACVGPASSLLSQRRRSRGRGCQYPHDATTQARSAASGDSIRQWGEFTSTALDHSAYWNKVQVDLSRPGTPVANSVCEAFNGSLSRECLSRHWFASLEEAATLLTSWQFEYNNHRPHSSSGDDSPARIGGAGVYEPRGRKRAHCHS